MTHPSKYIVYFVLLLLTATACRKSIRRPNWEVGVLLPLAYSELSINDLVQDTMIKVDDDGTLFFEYTDTVYSISPDSLIEVPDTGLVADYVIPDLQEIFPGFTDTALAILPDSLFQLPLGLDLAYDLPGGAELTYIKTLSGSFDYTISTTIEQEATIIYEVPSATKDGEHMVLITNMSGGSANNPVTVTGSFDLSGYEFDMTGSEGDGFNTVQQKVTIKGGSDTTYVATGDSIYISMHFNGIDPEVALGYFGQSSLGAVEDTVEFGTFNNEFFNGNISVESVDLRMTLDNQIGAEMGGTINTVGAWNTAKGDIELLEFDSLEKQLVIDRAPDSANSFLYHLDMNSDNSNIADLFNIQPDQLYFDIEVTTNPNGNTLNHGDFHYGGKAVHLITSAVVPLSIASDSLVISDTIDFGAGLADADLERFEGALILNVENAFPVAAAIDLQLLAEDSTDLGMLVEETQQIAAGPVTTDYANIVPVISSLRIPLTATSINQMTAASYIVVKATLSTASFPDYVTINEQQFIRVKLSAEADFTLDPVE